MLVNNVNVHYLYSCILKSDTKSNSTCADETHTKESLQTNGRGGFYRIESLAAEYQKQERSSCLLE